MHLSEFRFSLLNLLIAAGKDPEVVRKRPIDFLFAVRDAHGTTSPYLSSDTFEEMKSTGHIRRLANELYKSLFDYYRRDQANRNNQRGFDVAQDRYRELKARVLSTEQAEWILEQITVARHRDIETINALSYDEDSVVEAATRLQQNQDLVAWLNQLKHNSTRNYETLTAQRERAEEMLVDIKTALEALD